MERVGLSAGRGFKDLVAWQRADELASLVYHACKNLPRDHQWLASQAIRAAISVPANLAEGHGRGTLAEFLRFVDIARGSLSELEYYIHFLSKEQLLPNNTLVALDNVRINTGRVLFGLWQSLKAKSKGSWDHQGLMIHEESAIYQVIDGSDT